MLSIKFKSFAAAVVFTLAASAASAQSISCGKIGTAYDELFNDGNNRVQAVLAEFKALPSDAAESKKEAIRKKFCAVGGEIVGLYKFMKALGNDCAQQGARMSELLDVVNKQLGMAQDGVKICQ